MARRRFPKFFVFFALLIWTVKILHSKKDKLTPLDQRVQEVVLEGKKAWEFEDYLGEEDAEEASDYGRGRDEDRSPEASYRDVKLNENGTARVLWPDDEEGNCSRMDVRFAVGMTSSILHSFPRSGNTWVRYLLEAASGVFTSSVYSDRTLVAAGYLGERHKLGWGTTLATKSHFIKHLQKYKNIPTVTIIRNPARVFVSLWSYVNLKDRRRRHVESVAESSLRTQEFHDFIQSKLRKWLDTTLFSLTQCRDVLPVFYESVREDPIGETRRILEFLKVKPQEDRLSCMARHVSGNVKGAQKSLDPYTEEEKELFLQALKKVNETLVQRGFPTLPDYSKYNS
ncbi:WSC domain-containing protein 1-like [Penaeus chinensis]|uniref:WSC domain-containing protein 1-like n=1 Tax=Penaeus chinensis TaxID=139456 RepID=UPI001FB81ADD|nr:WSC domain-containing protein 1-like [Penaeus chinensis]